MKKTILYCLFCLFICAVAVSCRSGKGSDVVVYSEQDIRNEIINLINANRICTNYYYYTEDLYRFEHVDIHPAEGENVEIHMISSPLFPTFEDLKEFVFNTYDKTTAEQLIYHINPSNDGQLFYDLNGKMYLDYGRSYSFVLWEDWTQEYTFTFEKVNDKKYIVDVILNQDRTPYDADDGEIQNEEITMRVGMVLENGKWKFNDVLAYPERPENKV